MQSLQELNPFASPVRSQVAAEASLIGVLVRGEVRFPKRHRQTLRTDLLEERPVARSGWLRAV